MMSTTIKVKRETLKRLIRIVGELTIKLGRKVSYDEAIQFLIKNYMKKEEAENQADKKLQILLQKSFEVAGSDDFREYNYEDIGG